VEDILADINAIDRGRPRQIAMSHLLPPFDLAAS
jgi:hypothetical protein